MSGNNKYIFNQATMQAIVQEYFEQVLFTTGLAPTVFGVTQTGDGQFVVDAESKPQPQSEVP